MSLTTATPEATAAFLRTALGFVEYGEEERYGEEFARLTGVPSARACIRKLRLGQQEVELIAFAEKGRPYPANSTSRDAWFQHMAIVVSDMRAAYARLAASPGWTPISTAGPQRLPDSSGGVTAFKFRDPEGHPLELLEFPPFKTPAMWQNRRLAEPFLGIDHSAIVVTDTARSVAFYRALGFRITGASLNCGVEQERLDGLPGVEVEVTALQAAQGDVPHLELLCYRAPRTESLQQTDVRGNDIAATRLVLEIEPDVKGWANKRSDDSPSPGGFVSMAGGRHSVLIYDPDCHQLILCPMSP